MIEGLSSIPDDEAAPIRATDASARALGDGSRFAAMEPPAGLTTASTLSGLRPAAKLARDFDLPSELPELLTGGSRWYRARNLTRTKPSCWWAEPHVGAVQHAALEYARRCSVEDAQHAEHARRCLGALVQLAALPLAAGQTCGMRLSRGSRPALFYGTRARILEPTTDDFGPQPAHHQRRLHEGGPAGRYGSRSGDGEARNLEATRSALLRRQRLFVPQLNSSP